MSRFISSHPDGCWCISPIPAALIRVNHASKQIDIGIEDYGDEPAQWEQAKELALAAV